MAGKHVLIVDDDTEFVKLYSLFLKNSGLEVSAVYSAAEAMDALESTRPDIVVLDVMMDGFSDGFELAREIKAEPDLKDTLILMMTAVTEKTGIEFKSSAGDPTWLPVDGYVDKPVEPDALLAEIGKLLEKRS